LHHPQRAVKEAEEHQLWAQGTGHRDIGVGGFFLQHGSPACPGVAISGIFLFVMKYTAFWCILG